MAFLTQDATPADEHWLARLLDGFALAGDVALVHGPYRPRPGAGASVARELEEFFAAMAPDGDAGRRPRGHGRGLGATSPPVPTFFTDANGAVARWAWEQVPFPEVPYAEDRLLARRMLEAGYAKAYVPRAAVLHSHDYPP